MSLPALWHEEATEWFKEVRAKEELLLKAERLKQNKNFYCMTSSPTTSLFLSLKSRGIGIKWVLSNNIFKQ